MASFNSRISIPIATEHKGRFYHSIDHVTTSDFFKMVPVFIKEIVPNETIKISMSTFTRLAPLEQPMYGDARIINRAFFVPCRTVQEGWNELITDTPYTELASSASTTIPSHVTSFTMGALIDELDKYADTVTVGEDYSYKSGSNTVKRKFNAAGRRIYSILKSLGYAVNMANKGATSSVDYTELVSALPLLAYYKIYKDWYTNSQYPNYNDDVFKGIDKVLVSGVQGTSLHDLLSYLPSTLYDKDYFTAAFDNPTGPNSTAFSPVSIPDVTMPSAHPSQVDTDTNGTPFVHQSSSSSYVTTLSQFALDALKDLTDYAKRHDFAGTRALERLYARFGKRPSDAALNRSTYLGSHSVDVRISDVMATAQTESQAGDVLLGDYAGKGIGYENGGFTFKNNEVDYGYLIIVSVLMPKTGYVQGSNRMIHHTKKLDFYTPEFDNLGVQAIRRDELLGGLTTPPTSWDPSGVFGFIPRYAEYKVMLDNLSGDFLFNSRNVGLDSWHTFRKIAMPSGGLLVHNQNFTIGQAADFDRIFALGKNNEYDHFYNRFHFEVTCTAPMSTLFDNYHFSEEGKTVDMEIGGVQLN